MEQIMYNLGFDTTTKTVTAVISDFNKIIDEITLEEGAVQSVDLLPSISSLLKKNRLSAGDLSLISVSAGPGSFTGIRIGIATAKGLACAFQTPIAAVSSLESMAYCFGNVKCFVCPVIDARNNTVYTSLFNSDGCGNIVRITEDGVYAKSDINSLIDEYIEDNTLPIFFPGNTDITELSEKNLSRKNFLPTAFPNAEGVALLGEKLYRENKIKPNSYSEANPIYLGHSRYEINK